MELMYKYLVDGLTVPQSLRLAMLCLAHLPVPEKPHDVSGGLLKTWKRPMHWAAFLVVGATTRLLPNTPKGNTAAAAGCAATLTIPSSGGEGVDDGRGTEVETEGVTVPEVTFM